MASKLNFPDIFKYENFSDYLRDFFELNRKIKPAVTLGTLSRKIQWSKSLLHSLLKNNRNLTIVRALEFAEYAAMNIGETERILKFAIQSVSPTYLEDSRGNKNSAQQSRQLLEEYFLALSTGNDFPQANLANGIALINCKDLRAIQVKMGDIDRWLKKYESSTEASSDEPRSDYYLDLSLFNILESLRPIA